MACRRRTRGLNCKHCVGIGIGQMVRDASEQWCVEMRVAIVHQIIAAAGRSWNRHRHLLMHGSPAGTMLVLQAGKRHRRVSLRENVPKADASADRRLQARTN